MRWQLFASLRFVITTCAVVISSLAGSTLFAASDVWINGAGGDYNTSGNWQGGNIPNGVSEIADFSQLDLTADTSVTLDTAITLGQLLFGDTDLGSAGSWELRTSLVAPFPVITLNNGAAKPIIGVNTLTPTTFDDAFIAHSLAGTNGFVKQGAGIATLGTGTTNTITGGINIDAGTLRLRATIPTQAVTIANGATLDTTVEMRFAAGINVASGATANIIANANIGNLNAAGATLNFVAPLAGNTVSANDNWGLNGSPAAVNVSSPSGGFFRLRINGGGYVGASLLSTAVNLDNITTWTRTNSGGNTVSFGSLSGTSTAILSGGGQGGGTFATYSIGSLNTDTTFAGTIDTTSAPPGNTTTDLGGLNLTKVGTGKLTLSGTLLYQPDGNGTVNRRGGITTVSAGTLALTNSAAIPGGIVHGTVGEVLSTINLQAAGTLDVSGFSGSYSTASRQQIVGAGTVVGNFTHDEGVIRPANTITGTTASGLSPSVVAAGTINFSNNFTWSGGDYTYDMSLDPNSGNDLINVTGLTTLTSGSITPNFLAGTPSSGTYTVLTSAGGFSGSAAGITVNWPGRGTDPVPFVTGNNLQFIATDVNAGGIMTWVGNNATNPTYWDVQVTPNWTGASPNTFFPNDAVVFNDTATSFAVDIREAVQPSSVTLSNVTNAYVFSGTGAITGGTGLTKTGAGNVTLGNANTYTGATALSGGATITTLGSASPFGIGTLAMNGITVHGTTGAPSLSNSSVSVSGTNTIRADGTTGSTATFNIPTLSGTGTLTVTSAAGDPVTEPASGNGKWFALNGTGGFAGTLNLTGPTTTPEVPVQGLTVRTTTSGGGTLLGSAVVNMSNASMANRQGGTGTFTFTLGELHGDANSNLIGFTGGTGGRPNLIWEIGALNTNSDFAGGITDPGGTNATSGVFAWQDTTNNAIVDPVLQQIAIAGLRKIGTGTLTLTGLSGITGTGFDSTGTIQVISDTYSGDTIVDGGILSTTTPYLADFSDVYLGAGTTLNLNFGSLSTIDTVDSLFFNGVSQVTGTWGRIGSGAAHESAFITGDGLLMVSTFTGISGDYDGDGDVDGRDFLAWQRGTSPTPFSAADLATWQAAYNGGALQAVSSLAAVPEPCAGLLALGCGLALVSMRKRGR